MKLVIAFFSAIAFVASGILTILKIALLGLLIWFAYMVYVETQEIDSSTRKDRIRGVVEKTWCGEKGC